MNTRSSVRLLLLLLSLVSPVVAEASNPSFSLFSDSAGAVAGQTPSFWMVPVLPGESPASTGLRVWLDLRPIGGPARGAFVDQGLVCDDDTRDNVFFACFAVPANATPGTYDLTLTVADAQGRSSSRIIHFSVGAAPDADGDGLPDRWETNFHLDAASAVGDNGASGDPDLDGQTNLQEFKAGTHPRGTFTRYFAEGAVNDFFTTRVALFNPNTQEAVIELRFLGSTGGTTSTLTSLGPNGRLPYQIPDTIIPDSDFSVIVESDRPIVADRTMTWDGTRFGSHAETAIESPSTTWYLAEGATHGAFDLFYLLQNPTDADANVSVEYLRPAPLPPVVKSYLVAAHQRRTVWVDAEGPELAATDVSARITADRPIIAERSMYYSTPTQPFTAGHNGAGVTAPATHWFLAEGATGFFDLYVLIGNADANDATVKVTYLLPAGETVERSYTIAKRSRLTIDVAAQDARFTNTPVSMIVESTNAVPVVVERSMWWPHGQWYEAHLSAGATTTGTRWAFADGEVRTGSFIIPGFTDAIETYILIANTSATAGTATITLYSSSTPTLNVPLPAHSRVSVPASAVFATLPFQQTGQLGTFSAIIESSGPEIVVERSMYSNSVSQPPWAAGSVLLATRLQ